MFRTQMTMVPLSNLVHQDLILFGIMESMRDILIMVRDVFQNWRFRQALDIFHPFVRGYGATIMTQCIMPSRQRTLSLQTMRLELRILSRRPLIRQPSSSLEQVFYSRMAKEKMSW